VGSTILLFGASFGVLATDAGFTPLQATAMSALVMAGASQFAAVGALVAGSTSAAAWVAACAVAVRYIPLGIAVSEAVRGHGLPARLADTHLLTDQSVALGSRASGDVDISRYRWTGLVLLVTWVLGTGGAAVAASALPEPDSIGLDAAYPALFLALLIEQTRSDRRAVASGLAGGAIALLALAFVPPGIAVALAALGVLAVVVRPGRTPGVCGGRRRRGTGELT
jgi:4-azaleucine resistance transporter AzlC